MIVSESYFWDLLIVRGEIFNRHHMKGTYFLPFRHEQNVRQTDHGLDCVMRYSFLTTKQLGERGYGSSTEKLLQCMSLYVN